MQIFILSSGRAHRQTTWTNLPRSVQEVTKLVVPSDERAAYSGFPLLDLPNVVRDVTRTRQQLIEYVYGTADPFICMLDDDLTFAIRRDEDSEKFRQPREGEVAYAFAELEGLLEDRHFHHVGINGREGANRVLTEFKTACRMVRVLAYNTRILVDNGIRYDRLKLMSDFDVTLELLRRGHPNVVLNWIVQNQGASNAPGGCSQYRTDDLQKQDAFALAELHPRYVQVRVKKAWQGMGDRYDIVAYWKKAFEAKDRR